MFSREDVLRFLFILQLVSTAACSLPQKDSGFPSVLVLDVLFAAARELGQVLLFHPTKSLRRAQRILLVIII